jgi:two-component system nitrogen regulation response regulator NtrX
MMETELFGQLKGANPQAVRDKKGKILLADGGTLFLDEVGDLSLKTQARLVRALEERRFEPLGASEPVSFDSRMVAGTTRSLRELVVKGLSAMTSSSSSTSPPHPASP